MLFRSGTLGAAEPPPTPALERAIYEVTVNGNDVGDLIVWIAGDDVYVPVTALRDGGLSTLVPDVVHLDGVAYASLRHSKPVLSFVKNDPELTLTILAPAVALGQMTVDVADVAPQGTWHSEEPSVYLSYAPSVLDFDVLSVYGEAGFSAGDTRGSTSASVTSHGGPVRLLSQVVLSDRDEAEEWVLGDSFVNTGSLGGSRILGGVTLARNFALNPYLVRLPPLGYSASVLAPASVEVYVNGMLVRRVPVAPGQFTLRGLPPTAGAGTVRYVLRDAMGYESSVERQYYASTSLLAPGLSEYTFALGLARDRYGVESLVYGEPVFMSRYRIGLTSALSTGARVELAWRRFSVGGELVLAGTLGELELSWGGSSDYDGASSREVVIRPEAAARGVRRGAAGLLAYRYQSRAVAAATYARLTSRDYSNEGLDPSVNRDLLDQATTASFSLGRYASFGAQLGFAVSRDTGFRARESLLFNLQLASDLLLQTSAVRMTAVGLPDSYEAFTTLAWSLGGGHFGSLSGHASERGADGTLSFSRPIMEATGVGYQASASAGATQQRSAQVQGQASFIRGGATYYDDGTGPHAILDAAGTLVWMPAAGLFASRPINQAFAVVNVPGKEGLGVQLNQRDVGETDSDGQLFVPDLIAYQPNRIHVDAAHLPVNEEVDEGEVLMAPPLHGGAQVVFDVRAVRVVRGTVVPVGGTVTQFAYGELAVDLGERALISPIGDGGAFEFEQLPAGAWPAHVEGPEATCDFTLRVPQGLLPIQDLGLVHCAPRLRAPAASSEGGEAVAP